MGLLRINKNKKLVAGYSLVEVLVSLGMVGLLLTLLFNSLTASVLVAIKNNGRNAIREELDFITAQIIRDIRNADLVTACGATTSPNSCEYISLSKKYRWELCGKKVCKNLIDTATTNVYTSSTSLDVNLFSFVKGYSDNTQSRANVILTIVGSHIRTSLGVTNIVKQVSFSTRNYELAFINSLPITAGGYSRTDGRCVIGIAAANKNAGYGTGGFMTLAKLQTYRPGGFYKIFNLAQPFTSSNLDTNDTNLSDVDILFITHAPTGGDNSVLVTPTAAQLTALERNFNNGMGISITGDSGTPADNSANFASAMFNNATFKNYFQYKDALDYTASVNTTFTDAGVQFIYNLPINTSPASGLNSPGSISVFSPNICKYSIALNSGGSSCLFSYMPSQTISGAKTGFLAVDGNASYPTSTMIAYNQFWNLSPDCKSQVPIGGGAARYVGASTFVNDKFYSNYGYGTSASLASNDIYNFTTQTWSTGASAASALYDTAFATINNIEYNWGGYVNSTTPNGTNCINSYNPATNTWANNVTCGGTSAYSATGGAYNNKLYIYGGYNASLGTLKQLLIFNPATSTYSTGVNGLYAAYGSAIAVDSPNNKMYVLGGYCSNAGCTGYMNNLQIYNFATNTWTSGASAPRSRYYATALLYNGKIYFMGGYDGTNSQYSGTMDIYDIASNTWSAGPSSSIARAYHQVFVRNNLMYVFGGYNGSAALNSFSVFDLTTQKWQ